MPRPLRNYPPGSCLHIIQRGDNRSVCFHDDRERQHYLQLLSNYTATHGCELHAYVLMSNHIHLLFTIRERNAQARLMKDLSQSTSAWMHRRHGTTGTLWNGRYHSSNVDTERYLLTCQRYIELNPVRAGMADFPGGYRWSSYRGNAEGRLDALVTPHACYLALGNDAFERRVAYKKLFEAPLAQIELERIRFAVQHDFALGKPQTVKPGNQGTAR
ncbi:transposase [Massilia sp. SR12]